MLRMAPVSYYRALEEDQGARSDPQDGKLIYAPVGGLRLYKVDGAIVNLEGGRFDASVHQDKIFVFCASNQLSEELAREFGNFCVEFDPDCIIHCLKRRANSKSHLDYERIVSGKVIYRPNDIEPGPDWALPEKLVLMKPEGFARQDEFRIAIGKRGAFEVENVVLTLQIGRAAAEAASRHGHINLKIGRLEEVSKLHVF